MVDYLLKIVSYIVLLTKKIPALSKTVNKTDLPSYFIGFIGLLQRLCLPLRFYISRKHSTKLVPTFTSAIKAYAIVALS